jgi:hypothetical protein
MDLAVRKPYGCLTLPGLVSALLVILIVVGVGVIKGGILFSPGQLNAQAGAELGGVTSHAGLSNNCSACHAFFWQNATMAEHCKSCHTDVSAQQQDPTTLHGDQFKNNPGMSCRVCHPEHDGQTGALTSFSKADISHEVFGFALTGAHTALDCTKCHKNNVFTGLSTACASCHDDPAYHAGLFPGKACDQCHNDAAWAQATFNQPHPSDCGERSCLDHHRATCQDCHPTSLSASTCLKCHDSNNPGGDRRGRGD